MELELSCTTHEVDGRAVLAFAGEIDIHTAGELRERVLDAYRRGRTRQIIDLTRVTFIDSTGLGVLVGALKRVRTEGGSLQLVGPSEPVLEVFRVTGLQKLFAIHETVTDALAADE